MKSPQMVIKQLFYINLGLMFVVAGCSTSTSTKQPKITCEHAVKYHGRDFEVTGVEIPLYGKTVKIGRIGADEKIITQATQLTQALDLLQFADCQTMQMVGEENKMKIAARRNKTMETLSQLLMSINASTNASEYTNAVKKAQAAITNP